MVTTMLYHSISITRGRSASTMFANAWSSSKIHVTLQRTRQCHLHTRRRIIPNSSNAQTILRQPSRTTFTANQPFKKNSHRLFAHSPSPQIDTDIENLQTQQNDWKQSSLVNPTLSFETLLVPNAQLTKWITHPGIQHKLAKPDNWEFLKHVHPRIKLVQDYNENKQYKQLLLLPSSLSQESVSNHTATGILPDESNLNEHENDDWLSALLAEESNNGDEAPSIQKGPSRSMSISANQLSFQYILKRLLPESALPPPSAYEQIGHVAHFNLKKVHLPFKYLIGSALLESNTGDSIQTVVNKVGQVDGKFRTYECEILANNFQIENGDSDDTYSLLETTVVEDGISIELNVAECYWCTRLSGERKELIKDIVKGRKKPKADKVAPPLVVADVFCGAGAVCMLLAKKIKDQDKSWLPDSPQSAETKSKKNHPSLTIVANDWNPKAIEYMKRSIATNGMDKEQDESLYHKFDLSCRDSYDFLSELGEEKQTTKANPYIKKKLLAKNKGGVTKEEPPFVPDHVLMNFPLEAPQFLGAIRWWSWKRLRDEAKRRSKWQTNKKEWAPRFHVYTFARASSPRASDEEEMAVNLVANELLPEQLFDHGEEADESNDKANKSDSIDSVSYRREALDDEFGTEFSTRLVRDVAPGKVVVCVSFSVTPKLIRYMQGDYS